MEISVKLLGQLASFGMVNLSTLLSLRSVVYSGARPGRRHLRALRGHLHRALARPDGPAPGCYGPLV
jgi:hypothetical protein